RARRIRMRATMPPTARSTKRRTPPPINKGSTEPPDFFAAGRFRERGRASSSSSGGGTGWGGGAFSRTPGAPRGLFTGAGSGFSLRAGTGVRSVFFAAAGRKAVPHLGHLMDLPGGTAARRRAVSHSGQRQVVTDMGLLLGARDGSPASPPAWGLTA